MNGTGRIVLGLVLALCAPLLWGASVQGGMLLYQVSEPGLEPYPSRLLVSEDFLRMDDGEATGDFILFDRKARTIYGVTHGDQTIFVIPPRQLAIESPELIERASAIVAGPEPLPPIGGQTPLQRRLTVNGQGCYNLISVEGLMPEAVAALKDFREVLSGEHKSLLPSLPADMREPCDLALHSFHPGWQLEFGLPVREWDEKGKGQFLIDIQPAYTIDTQWFELPAAYRRYSSDQL